MLTTLALFLAMSISESQRAPIFCLYVASAVFCLLVEGIFPDWILQYSNGRVQFLDSAIGLLTAMIALGGGLWQLLDEPSPATEQDATRLLVLSLGGLIGFVTFLGT